MRDCSPCKKPELILRGSLVQYHLSKLKKIIDLHIAYLGSRNNCTEEGAERCDSDNALLRECIRGFGSSVTETARTDAHYDNSPKRVSA